MIGLADLVRPDLASWTDATPDIDLPKITGQHLPYNIAEDCLQAPGDRVALIDIDPDLDPHRADGVRGRQLTFAELADAAGRCAALLTGHGVGAGDRVAVKLPQGAAMAAAVLGTLRVGAIVVTVSDVLGDEAIAHRLRDSGARVLVCSGDDRERRIAGRAGAAVVPARDPDWLDRHEPLTTFPGTTTDDPALLLYTSGTTGKSKGVLHAHRVLLGHHGLDLAWDRVRVGDVAYSPVDWTWGGGLFLGLLAPLAYGMAVVAFREPHFDPARTAAIMRATGVSVGLFPPTALRALQRSQALTAEAVAGMRLRALVTGAEAVEPELTTWARRTLDLSINNAFGQTEANALVGHAHVLGDLDPASLGRAYPGHRVAILDAAHQPVPDGELGEIAVRADDPVCMLGYWNDARATSAKLGNGWLLTGDSGRRDAEGNLFFHGRADDLIKSGGYRIGPAEIEAALFSHPAVQRCAAVGLPDPVRGQQVVAYVVLADGFRAGTDLTAELQDRVRTQVGAHAYPRRVEYVDGLATTTTGKVDRRALRDSGPVTTTLRTGTAEGAR